MMGWRFSVDAALASSPRPVLRENTRFSWPWTAKRDDQRSGLWTLEPIPAVFQRGREPEGSRRHAEAGLARHDSGRASAGRARQGAERLANRGAPGPRAYPPRELVITPLLGPN
jgi:hypothetical protein